MRERGIVSRAYRAIEAQRLVAMRRRGGCMSSLLGGVGIGLASGFLLLTLGRIAGISGIVGGLLGPPGPGDRAWRVAFVLGLPLGAALVAAASPDAALVVFPTRGAPLLAAGVLVGIGTRLGSGCTSGHGVCGMARGSARSFAATATFMVVAAATVFVVRHVIGVAS